ncbi:5763_t:CDS:1, partial [Cetraspora pellucida]
MFRNRYVSFRPRKNYIRRPSHILTTTKYGVLNMKNTGISTSNNNCNELVHDDCMLSEDSDCMLKKKDSNDMLVEDNSGNEMLYEVDMLSEDD